MQQPFAFSRGPVMAGFGTTMRAFGTAARTAQTIGIEWLDYAKQGADDLTATMGKLAAARTPADALAIQGAFLHTAGERFTARSAVLGDLFVALACDLARPMGGSGPLRTR